jgi:predicted permease
VTVGILSMLAVAAVAVLLGWLAVHFTTELTGAFEVIADIVGWILLPFRI